MYGFRAGHTKVEYVKASRKGDVRHMNFLAGGLDGVNEGFVVTESY